MFYFNSASVFFFIRIIYLNTFLKFISFKSFKSKAASKTIKISPNVPNTFKRRSNSVLLSDLNEGAKYSVANPEINPTPIRSKTEGIPDFLEYTLKK